MMEYKSWVEGPRWAGLRSLVKKGAMQCNLDLLSIDSDKGFLTETVYFEVSGDDECVKRFAHGISRSIDAYNRE